MNLAPPFALMLALASLAASTCTHNKVVTNSNCSFRYQCYSYIRDEIPQECQESSNELVTVDLTLIKPNDSQPVNEVFLSFVTTLTMTGLSHHTKLSPLQYTLRLINLQLSGNQIESIDGEPFIFLGNLETLDLSHNKLSNIDKLFHFEYYPNRLRKLTLADNQIVDIQSNAFEELTFLSELDLSNNLISDLTAEPFSNLTKLEILRLDNNRIKNLNGAVNDLQNLKKLFLRGNQIENIDEKSLNIINHLETFDISLNELEQIKPIMFSRHWIHLGGHSIFKINLSDNKITLLPNTSREMTTRFTRDPSRRRGAAMDISTELNLSRNEIRNVEYNAFQSLIKLNSLDLSQNKIINFAVNADDIVYVRFLNLSGNHIYALQFESFSGMNSLQNLDLSHNKLDYIPDTFHNNYNLQHVNLTHNEIEKLDSLHIDIFHPQGGILDLSNNGLTQLRIPVGEGRRLKVLLLHSNKISDPSLIDLSYHSDLKTLDMSRNRIRDLDEKSLLLPVVLNYLDLSCNIIQSIAPSTFLRIGHLKTLSLAHNQLKSIEYGAFRGLQSLLTLDLSFNKLIKVDSKLFMDLKSLSVLSLRHNGLFVLKDEAWYSHKFDLKVYLEGNNFTCEWLGAALNNFNNGFTKMRPTVFERVIYGHSLDGIPCIPGNLQLQASGTVDERLLIVSQKILAEVQEQNNYLRKFLWRSLQQEDVDKHKTYAIYKRHE